MDNNKQQLIYADLFEQLLHLQWTIESMVLWTTTTVHRSIWNNFLHNPMDNESRCYGKQLKLIKITQFYMANFYIVQWTMDP